MPVAYAEKKELIKRSAVKVFAHYGYQKTTLDDIAGQLGIKKNSLYYYFKSKEAIFAEIINDEFRVLIEELNKISKSDGPVKKKMNDTIHKLVYFGQERSSVYSFSLETFFEIGQIIHESFTEIKNSVIEILTDILKSGIKTGELKRHNSRQLAEHILGTLQALQYREFHSNPTVSSIKEIDLSVVENSFSYLLNLILNGLQK